MSNSMTDACLRFVMHVQRRETQATAAERRWKLLVPSPAVQWSRWEHKKIFIIEELVSRGDLSAVSGW